MLGRPSLRRRLIISYLVVVIAVTSVAFVTVQVLVPQFFEQAVQQRLGPGSDNGNGTGANSPGQGQGSRQETTTTLSPDSPGDTGPGNTGSTTSAPPPETGAPEPTGSTIGPGTPDPGAGNGGQHGNDGAGGDGAGPGGPTTTTVESFTGYSEGTMAAARFVQDIEQSPIPVEIQEDYDRALTAALLIAVGIGLLIALVLGWWLTRRLLGTFAGIRDGASKLADGHYAVRVPVPPEAELADLAESVNTLADSLQRTEQTRARLVSDLAHEIRNPLSTIEGYMEGLIDGVLPESRETYEAVANEAHRLKRLTWDLSTLSKAQEGAIEYVIAGHDLMAIATRVVETLRPQYDLNDVELLVDSNGPMPVHVDSDRIAQALTNLLGNALSHTPPGGRVYVTGSVDDRWCSVAVTDTGSGIPEAELNTIFERFTRLDTQHSGTGIGLNIARTLVRAQGGDITASSRGSTAGARFDLSLPRSRSDQSATSG